MLLIMFLNEKVEIGVGRKKNMQDKVNNNRIALTFVHYSYFLLKKQRQDIKAMDGQREIRRAMKNLDY